MANASQLNLKLGIDVSNLDRELGKVEKSLSKFGNSMKNIGTNLTQSLTVPIIGLGIASVKAFSDMEKLEKGLTAIMGSSELAKDEIVKLREVAKLPGLGLKEAVQGSINLQAVGLSAEEAKSTLMGFGTALAAVGKGKVELEAIQYQLTQMISKNKLLAEDYKVIQSNLPLMAEGMRAAFGTSNIDAIRETGISAKDFTLQLSNALSLLPQTQNVTGGLANSFENLSDNIFISLNELGKTINETLKLEEVFTKISDKIQMMVDKFKALSPAQQENIVKFALFAAAIGPIILVVGQLATSISSIIALTRTLMTLFSIAASATGIGALTLAVVGLGVAYYNTNEGQKTINQTGSTLLKTFGYLKDIFSNIIKLLGHLIKQLKSF
jgi:tape measure domain-containing protein